MKLKVISKISKEVAYTWVIAITQYRFTAKMFTIVPQFIVNIFKLSVKLVLFCFFSFIYSSFCHILYSSLPLLINRLISMSNMDAIFISISKEGWLTLEHHREMVASFFANSPASHFLFFPLFYQYYF